MIPYFTKKKALKTVVFRALESGYGFGVFDSRF